MVALFVRFFDRRRDAASPAGGDAGAT